MFSLEDRPTPPATPVFSTEMANFLVATARTSPARRTSRARTSLAVGIAAVAIAVGATVAIVHSRNAPRPLSASPGRASLGPVHVHLAAFSLDSNTGGTVTLSLTKAQTLDPGTMRQALAQAGVPALINVGSVCYNPHPDRSALFQFVSPRRLRADGSFVMVMTPSKMPAGSKLSLGYFPDHVRFTLLTAGAPMTCSSNPPPPQGQPTAIPSSPTVSA